MSTISPAFSSNAFQARKSVAFGGAGNTPTQNQARFSGLDVMKGVPQALFSEMAKQPAKHTGKLNYFA